VSRVSKRATARTIGKAGLVCLTLSIVSCSAESPSEAPWDASSPIEELPDQTNGTDAGRAPPIPIMEEPVDAGTLPDAARPVPSFELDPDRVYVFGTVPVPRSDRGLRVICDPLDLEQCMGVVPQTTSGLFGVISPDGKLVYGFSNGRLPLPMRALGADPLSFTSVDPAQNDPVITTPPPEHDPCATDANGSQDLNGVDGGPSVLCGTYVVTDGEAHPITGLPEMAYAAETTRENPRGGFWAVFATYGVYRRWTIERDGTATLDGRYANTPGNFKLRESLVPRRSVLDGEGNFYALGTTHEGATMAIVRYRADFSVADVIYDEHAKPRVMLEPTFSEDNTFVTGN
jgi:hypothetical protein